MVQHQSSNQEMGQLSSIMPAGLSRPAGYLAKGMTAASVAGLLFAISPAHEALAAPDLAVRAKYRNPLMIPVSAATFSKPALADMDADGDLDLFVGGGDGHIEYFKNEGSATAPDFRLQVGAANPFWYLEEGEDADYVPYDVGERAAPALVDYDNDGQIDAAVVGASDGYLDYFVLDRSGEQPRFVQQTGEDNPFDGVYAGIHTTPTFADIDNDGDQDLFVGDGYAFDTIRFFENTATDPGSPVFSDPEQNPFGLSPDCNYCTPAFVDIDNDGDLDAFMGNRNGTVTFFKNVGDAENPDFNSTGGEMMPQTRALVPGETVDVNEYSAPAFADIDGDGDQDMLVGGVGESGDQSRDSAIFFYKNTGTTDSPAFTLIDGKNSPTWGFDVGGESRPAFADIDNDGDLDAFIGNNEGQIRFFENLGDARSPDFNEQAPGDEDESFVKAVDYDSLLPNPLGDLNLGYSLASVAFVDFDDDGDLDAFIGSNEGQIRYFKNFGDAEKPDFAEKADENPFDMMEFDGSPAPAFFEDIDGDGDLEAFVAHNYYWSDLEYDGGKISYFELNDEGMYEENETDNPFRNFAPTENFDNYYPVLTVDDFDGDGQWEALVGEADGNINYFEYTTYDDDTPAEFVADNPYGEADMGALEMLAYSAPVFVDIDGDGDLDLFVGEEYGRTLFAENLQIVDLGPSPLSGSGGDSGCFINSAADGDKTADTSSPVVRAFQNLYQTVRQTVRQVLR